MKRVLALLLALVMVFALTACGKAEAPAAAPAAEAPAAAAPAAEAEEPAKLMAEPMTFKVSFAEDANNILVIECQKAFDEITEATNGYLLFELFPSNALGSIPDVAEQMTLGAPIIHSFGMDGLAEYCSSFTPLSSVFTFQSYDEFFALMETDYWAGLMDELRESANFYVISAGATGWRSFISSKPIRSAADINGMNIRMGPSEMPQTFIKLLGGSPFTSTWADNYTNIQTGIYDACEGPLSLIYSSSLYEVGKYLTLSEHLLNAPMLTVSGTYWDMIPAEYQAIVTEKLDAAFACLLEQQKVDDASWAQKFEEAGCEVIVPDKSTFSAVAPDLLEALGFDPAIYNDIRAAIEEAMAG